MFFSLILVIFLAWGNVAQAGFGISPPYVKTSKPIFAGAHYEQRITLLRSSAEEDLQAKITINAPEVASWVSVDKGDVFDLPKGELQVPMVIRVDVPNDAEIGNYKGYINVRIAPKEGGPAGSGVAIALGARVDIDLDVTDETFAEFLVRNIDIPDFETLPFPWKMKIFSHFFYKVKVVLDIENSGNVKIAPTKVSLDVYDLTEREMLESYIDKSIEEIDPFARKNISADFRTKLSPGQYWGTVKVYKDNDVIRKDKIAFTVFKSGEGGIKPDLGAMPWVMLSTMILAVLGLIVTMIKMRSWRALFIILLFLSYPIRFIFRRLSKAWRRLKIKFWKWVHRKASKYQDIDKKR